MLVWNVLPHTASYTMNICVDFSKKNKKCVSRPCWGQFSFSVAISNFENMYAIYYHVTEKKTVEMQSITGLNWERRIRRRICQHITRIGHLGNFLLPIKRRLYPQCTCFIVYIPIAKDSSQKVNFEKPRHCRDEKKAKPTRCGLWEKQVQEETEVSQKRVSRMS